MKVKLSSKRIRQAVLGNSTAISKIIMIYQPYINTLASKKLYESQGNEYIGINVDLQERLINKLIDLIYAYKIG